MPPFRTLNPLDSIKPGATVLSYVRATSGQEYPAVVTQRFGKGRTLAVTIGDLWRWGLRRGRDEPNDLGKAWRQMVRWLVADVPNRLEVQAAPAEGDPDRAVQLRIVARDARFEPLDNAQVVVNVTAPDKRTTTLTAEADEQQAGLYRTDYVAAQRGSYLAEVNAKAADGSDVATVTVGWTAEPGRREFQNLEARQDLLEKLARNTGGEIVDPERLLDFVADLPNRKNVVSEPWVHPFWHQWWVFGLAVACFVGEWGLRRWKGLP
jgi:hypothetical protein